MAGLKLHKKVRVSSIILAHVQRQKKLLIALILFEDVVFSCVFCILNCYGEEENSWQAALIANFQENLRFQEVFK